MFIMQLTTCRENGDLFTEFICTVVGSDCQINVLITSVCVCRCDDELGSILATTHSLSFLRQSSTPFKDMTAEIHNAKNNRPHVV